MKTFSPLCQSCLTDLFRSISTAVTVKPMVQTNSSTVEPKDWITAPASTEAMGVMPWEPMLVRLLTLLSLSWSTMRMMAVLAGTLIQAIIRPTTRQPEQKETRNAFGEPPGLI